MTSTAKSTSCSDLRELMPDARAPLLVSTFATLTFGSTTLSQVQHTCNSTHHAGDKHVQWGEANPVHVAHSGYCNSCADCPNLVHPRPYV